MDTPGAETLWIVDDVPVLDDAGQPVRDENLKPRWTESTAQVDGCSLQSTRPTSPAGAEQETDTTTTSDVRLAFLPVTTATRAVTSRSRIREEAATLAGGGRDYEVRGNAVVQIDLDGFPSHVIVLCERQNG